MKIDFFDVGHGACSAITGPNGKKIMIDCGYRSDPYWWPSTHFTGERFEVLFLTNLDEDHVADFGDVMTRLNVGSLTLNDSIDAHKLRALKTDGMMSGVRAVHRYIAQLFPSLLNNSFDVSPVSVTIYRNR